MTFIHKRIRKKRRNEWERFDARYFVYGRFLTVTSEIAVLIKQFFFNNARNKLKNELLIDRFSRSKECVSCLCNYSLKFLIQPCLGGGLICNVKFFISNFIATAIEICTSEAIFNCSKILLCLS